MPIYEYFCINCEQHVSLLHSSEEKREECPACKQESLERVYSSFSVKENNDAGKIVTSAIEEAKRDLKEQKKDARRDY